MSLVVYLAAVVCALACVVLFRRRLSTALRDPLARSAGVSIVLGSLVFACAAPTTLAAVNDLTGIPNFGAPLTYGMLSAFSCSLFVLLVNWRGGSAESVRRTTRRVVAAYGALIVAIIVLFALADADTERLSDLDTYYANTPYMRELIVLYLLGHSAAMLAMCVVGVKWEREVSGPLRGGLRLIVIGALLDLVGFQLTKYTAVVARWTGHDLDVLSTSVAPWMAALAACLFVCGFVLPRLLPAAQAHHHSLHSYRRLRPLWLRVEFASTAPSPPRTWWQSPGVRLRWREVHIHDALLALAPYFDDRIREQALDGALRAGGSAHEARLTAEAAMVAEAARRAGSGETPPDPPSAHRLYATEVTGTDGLVELARALGRSTHVTPVCEGTVKAAPN